MHVLVTGGAGFIGSHWVDRLLDAGHAVTVLDNLSTGRRVNLDPRARLVEMDIRDPALGALLSELRPEVIAHHAAQVGVARSMLEPRLDAEINLMGSLALLDAAVAAGVRKVLYISTAAVYGEPECLPVPEDHALAPLSPYGASKLAVETYLPLYAAAYGLDYSVLRCANVYGPRQDPHGDAGVVAIFAGRMQRGEACTIYGSGEQARDFVYVGDCARAGELLLGDAGSRDTLNLGTGELTSISSLHARLVALSGAAPAALLAPARPGEIFKLSLDPTRARAILGWRPETGLDEGLARTMDWFRVTAAPA